jgi:hypothetical protein
MNTYSKAFELGIRAALDFFKSKPTKEALIKVGESVLEGAAKAAQAASKVR